jgi:hypothetical protein
MSYASVHEMLRYHRGSASGRCYAEDCVRPAIEWAWLRTGRSATEARQGGTVTYGLDHEDYVAMCGSHAKMMDHGGTLTHCPRGHDRKVGVSRYSGGCIVCVRENSREYARRKRAERKLHAA